MTDIETLLTYIPLFAGLTKRQRRRLAGKFVQRTYETGQNIVTQDSLGVGMYIVASGRAEAIRRRQDGAEVAVNSFGPTDFFGELALLAEGPRTATVTALETTTCLVIMRSDFLELMRGDAQMATTVAIALADRFRQALEAL